jgi:hypothetical protein
MLLLTRASPIKRGAGGTPFVDAAPEAANSTAGWGSFTVMSRTWQVGQNRTVQSLGMNNAAAASVVLKLVERTGAGAYTVHRSAALSHPGGGWEDVSITPYDIGPSGTFYVAVYIAAGSITTNNGSLSVSYKSGDISVTTHTGVSEASNNPPILRASGSATP